MRKQEITWKIYNTVLYGQVIQFCYTINVTESEWNYKWFYVKSIAFHIYTKHLQKDMFYKTF